MRLCRSTGPTTTLPPATGRCADYSTLINMSMLFYEAQRSGKLPATQRVTWRKDSALNDKGKNGEDLTGGYYDGNDRVVNDTFTFKFSCGMQFNQMI